MKCFTPLLLILLIVPTGSAVHGVEEAVFLAPDNEIATQTRPKKAGITAFGEDAGQPFALVPHIRQQFPRSRKNVRLVTITFSYPMSPLYFYRTMRVVMRRRPVLRLYSPFIRIKRLSGRTLQVTAYQRKPIALGEKTLEKTISAAFSPFISSKIPDPTTTATSTTTPTQSDKPKPTPRPILGRICLTRSQVDGPSALIPQARCPLPLATFNQLLRELGRSGSLAVRSSVPSLLYGTTSRSMDAKAVSYRWTYCLRGAFRTDRQSRAGAVEVLTRAVASLPPSKHRRCPPFVACAQVAPRFSNKFIVGGQFRDAMRHVKALRVHREEYNVYRVNPKLYCFRASFMESRAIVMSALKVIFTTQGQA